MSKNKTYSVLIISLLVINTLLVGFVVLKPKRPLGKENKSPKEIIIKRLQFNEAQTSHYTTLVKQHSTAIREKDAKIRDSKKNLYSLLANDSGITGAVAGATAPGATCSAKEGPATEAPGSSVGNSIGAPSTAIGPPPPASLSAS